MQNTKEELPFVHYTPASALRNPLRLVAEMRRDLFLSLSLGWRLTLRDIRAQYRQSILGFFWAVVPPVVTAFLFIFLKNINVMQIHDTTIPYECYAMAGSLVWHIFLDALNGPLRVVQSSKSMLTKIHFPREALIFSSFGQTVFRSSIRWIILMGVLIYFGMPFGLNTFSALVLLFVLVLFGMMIGLFLTPLGLLYNDFSNVLPMITTLWFLVTPVMYPIPSKQPYAFFIQANPVTSLLTGTRELLTQASLTDPFSILVISLVTLVGVLFTWLFYRVSMPFIIERIGS